MIRKRYVCQMLASKMKTPLQYVVAGFIVTPTGLKHRTFTGLLYKQVKAPNLVGSLTGHVEGSRAFVRYRNIDEDMK